MDEKQKIEKVIHQFIQAYNEGNLDGILSCYDDRLIKMRQGATAESKAELALRLQQIFKNFSTSLEVVNDEFLISGELAVVRGSLQVTLRSRSDGQIQIIDRRFLEVWQKLGDKWLVTHTMDNSACAASK